MQKLRKRKQRVGNSTLEDLCMTRFLGASAARSVLLSFPGNERDWRCTANPENTVLPSTEVTDLMLGLKLIHMTRETVRLQVCRLHGHLPNLV